MNQTNLFKKSPLYICLALGVGGVGLNAQASVTVIQQGNNSGIAKIGWGNKTSGLSEARTILYADKTNTANQTTINSTTSTANATTVRRYDNGYGSSATATTSTYYTPSNTYNQQPSPSRYNSGFTPYNAGTSTYSSNANTSNYASSSYASPSYASPSYGSSNFGSSYSETLPISTGSRGVYVMDAETGQPLYQKNANIARPIASISKLMTAMVILDAGQDMREEIILEPEDFIGPKRASSRLKSGDRMNRAELLLMTLMKSENPAAKSLARHYPGGFNAFVRAMNAKAQSLGMTTAYFGDPTGLDKNNVASPVDVAKMVKAAGDYEVIRRFSTTKNYDFYVANYNSGSRNYPARNTSYIVRDGLYPIGISKTGFINEAGQCVVMESQVNNRPAIVVILGAENSKMRWRDAESILDGLALRRSV